MTGAMSTLFLLLLLGSCNQGLEGGPREDVVRALEDLCCAMGEEAGPVAMESRGAELPVARPPLVVYGTGPVVRRSRGGHPPVRAPGVR